MPAAASYEHSAAIAPKCAEDVIVRHHVLQEDDEAWREKVLDATVKLLEEEPVAAYVFGELAFTRTVVAGLPARGIEASRIAAKPYWREDRANESNGEPPREDAAESE
jgi:NADPH-dependent ferric siderophore reductase